MLLVEAKQYNFFNSKTICNGFFSKMTLIFKLFISDCTKKIRLLALNYYALIVDSGPNQLSPRRNLELVM